MRVAIQYARATPQDWEVLSITRDGDWRGLPKKDDPRDGASGTVEVDLGPDFGIQPVLDVTDPSARDPGWLNMVCVLGARFSPDHLHVKTGTGLTLTYWNDSPLWTEAGNRHAEEWTIRLPTWDAQRDFPKQNVTKRIWYEDAAKRDVRGGPGDVLSVMDWASFSPPGPANMVMHSVFLTPDLLAAHEAALSDVMGLVPEAQLAGTRQERLQAMLTRWG